MKTKQDRTAERGRFSAKRKKEAVLRLLKGEELDALSQELGVTAAVLSEWREKFLGSSPESCVVGPEGVQGRKAPWRYHSAVSEFDFRRAMSR